MRKLIDALREPWLVLEDTWLFRAACAIAVLSAIGMSAPCQSPAPDQSPAATQAPAQATPAPASQLEAKIPSQSTHSDAPIPPSKDPVLSQGAFTVHTVAGAIKEDQLRQLLAGKTCICAPAIKTTILNSMSTGGCWDIRHKAPSR